LRREIAKWTRSKELALQQISHLREILELSQKARAYLMTASADLILQLYNGENWGAHPELEFFGAGPLRYFAAQDALIPCYDEFWVLFLSLSHSAFLI